MTLPRYPAYRDSGVEWLGEVPAHWRSGKITMFARLESGHTPSRQHPEYWEDCSIPWFTLADVWQIRDGNLRYVSDTKEKVSELGLANSSARLLPRGTVILSRTASVGFSAIMAIDMATTQDFANWVCGGDLVPEYLHYCLLGMKAEFDRLMMGSTHQTIYMPDIGKLAIAVPSVSEQQAVIYYLDRETGKIDGLVREQERLIELLAEKRRAVVSHAVTKGLDPNAPMKDSGIDWLGEVPAHWVTTKLGRHLDVLSGYAFPSAGFSEDEADMRLLRGVNVGIQEIRWTEVVYWERTADDGLGRFLLAPGQLVMGMDRPWIGTGARVAILTQDDAPCLLLQRVAALMPLPGLSRDFVFLILQSRDFEDYFTPDMTGVSVPHISPEQIRSFPFALPPLEEQLQIAAYLRDDFAKLDALAAEAERAVALLKERRAALISAAVTGKIDVRGISEEAA